MYQVSIEAKNLSSEMQDAGIVDHLLGVYESTDLANLVNEIHSHGLEILTMDIDHHVNDETGDFVYEVYFTIG